MLVGKSCDKFVFERVEVVQLATDRSKRMNKLTELKMQEIE